MGTSGRKIEILEAASKVVAEKGIFNLTFEAVAKEAGLSKGGLLYHFPSKELLVEEMVEHLAGNYKRKIDEQATNDVVSEGKWTRAYLDVTFKNTYKNKNMHAGLLAAKAINPDLMQPIREVYEEWQKAIDNDQINPTLATIIRLAADGIWLADLFEINPISEEKKIEIYETLKMWVGENGPK